MRISGYAVRVVRDGALILDDVNFQIPSGRLTVLLGPNGSGKSTLLGTLTGYVPLSSGTVTLDDVDIRRYSVRDIARRVAALEQDPFLGFDFTVQELVGCGRIPHRGRLARWTTADTEAVAHALELTATSQLKHRLVHTLSGGERQRAFLALTLAQQPQALLLDEPTAHLDLRHQIDTLDRVHRIAGNGTTVVAALHDLNLAVRYADNLLVLDQGRLRAAGPPSEVLDRDLVRSVWQVEVDLYEGEQGTQIVPRRLGAER